MKLLRARAKHEASIPTLDLVARDIADADAHLSEALTLLAGRVSREITDTLIEMQQTLHYEYISPPLCRRCEARDARVFKPLFPNATETKAEREGRERVS
jgi:hypothetical protein